MTATNGKYLILIVSLLTFLGCNKIKQKIESKMPTSSYRDSGIDRFYWARELPGDVKIIPLVKPYYKLEKSWTNQWELNRYVENMYDIVNIHNIEISLGSFVPVKYFGINNHYIYGLQEEKLDLDEKTKIPEIWFIINTVDNKFTLFETEAEFKSELKKLNLPEKFLNPDNVYEQYKQDPILPWFPEEIKKQLAEVKK